MEQNIFVHEKLNERYENNLINFTDICQTQKFFSPQVARNVIFIKKNE